MKAERASIAAAARAVGADRRLLAALRAAYWSDRPDVTWTEGGCWVFAKAFRRVFGGTYVYVWVIPGASGQDCEDHTSHVGVELPEHPGWVFDAKGCTRSATWFDRHCVFGPYEKNLAPSMIGDKLVRGRPLDHRLLYHDVAMTDDVVRALRAERDQRRRAAQTSTAQLDASALWAKGTSTGRDA